ncbi:hypothetical protein GCM10023339_69920 [Alloalcanivorax gelatiniphagus]
MKDKQKNVYRCSGILPYYNNLLVILRLGAASRITPSFEGSWSTPYNMYNYRNMNIVHIV